MCVCVKGQQNRTKHTNTLPRQQQQDIPPTKDMPKLFGMYFVCQCAIHTHIHMYIQLLLFQMAMLLLFGGLLLAAPEKLQLHTHLPALNCPTTDTK